MKLKRLLSVLDVCECTADPELDIRDISFDSRTTQPGDLFAAVCGYESDGHRFIGAAAERGAAVVLCQRKPEVEIPYILVADSRLALSRICCEFFDNPSRELTMIGVTGTNGKTTVTTLIKHMLEQCLHTKVGLIGTNANVIGDEVLHTEHTTPDAYELQKLLRRMVDAGCTHAVMEVSSHSLVLHRVEGIRFRVGIFTNLSQDHLDFHKTMEAYAAAKAQLFAQSDVGIVNADDDWAHVMLEHAKCPMHTYSAKRNDADLVAKDIRLSASGVRFVAMHGDAIARMRLGIPGMFSVYNALSVIACACALGISLADCAAMADTFLYGKIEGEAQYFNQSISDFYEYTLVILSDTSEKYAPGDRVTIAANVLFKDYNPQFQDGMRIVTPIRADQNNTSRTYFGTEGTSYVTPDGYAISAFEEDAASYAAAPSGLRVETLLEKLKEMQK